MRFVRGTPADQLVTIEEIGRVAAFLVSGAGAPLSGSVIYATTAFTRWRRDALDMSFPNMKGRTR
jgi:enoyl-[acyl-carrier-protein] reductase (NADH)